MQEATDGFVAPRARIGRRNGVHATVTKNRVLVACQLLDQCVSTLLASIHDERHSNRQPADNFLVLRVLRVRKHLLTGPAICSPEHDKTHCEAGRLSWHGKYLKPAKKLLVDLTVTQTGLDKAIAFANELFLALEARDHRVVIAPNSERFHRADVDERENPGKGHHHNNLWSPMRCTVVYIGTVAIGLTVIEMSEAAEARYVNGEYVRLTDIVPKRRSRYAQDYGWTSTHDFPTGRLCLQAYSPYPRANWTQQWRETPSRDLSGRISAIVRELEKATVEIARLVEQGERQAEIERQRREAEYERWRREEEARQAAKALKDSKEGLLQVIDAWAEAKRLDAFFADAERRAHDLPDEQRERTIERLRRARALIGSTDALERFSAWRAPEER